MFKRDPAAFNQSMQREDLRVFGRICVGLAYFCRLKSPEVAGSTRPFGSRSDGRPLRRDVEWGSL
jgi:hypothetical protein